MLQMDLTKLPTVVALSALAAVFVATVTAATAIEAIGEAVAGTSR